MGRNSLRRVPGAAARILDRSRRGRENPRHDRANVRVLLIARGVRCVLGDFLIAARELEAYRAERRARGCLTSRRHAIFDRVFPCTIEVAARRWLAFNSCTLHGAGRAKAYALRYRRSRLRRVCAGGAADRGPADARPVARSLFQDSAREIHIPGCVFKTLRKTAVTGTIRQNQNEPPYNRSLIGRDGKVLGGSSSINAMIYIRGIRPITTTGVTPSRLGIRRRSPTRRNLKTRSVVLRPSRRGRSHSAPPIRAA